MEPTPIQSQCDNCGDRHSAAAFCPACGQIQPLPPQADHYLVLGMTPTLVIAADDLDAIYFDLSRRLHPDRFGAAPRSARDLSANNMAVVNRAYQTLRDPVARARYWLSLQGESVHRRELPGALAKKILAAQEALIAWHGTTALPQRDSLRPRLASMRDDLAALRVRTEDRLAEAGRASTTEQITLVKEALESHIYLDKVVRDLEAALA